MLIYITYINLVWIKDDVHIILKHFNFRRCGHTPVAAEDALFMTKLKDNSKQLFSIIIDDTAVQTLLKNQTIEEVIEHVLKLANA